MVPFSTGSEEINDDDIVVRTARISTLEKQNVNCLTEKTVLAIQSDYE